MWKKPSRMQLSLIIVMVLAVQSCIVLVGCTLPKSSGPPAGTLSKILLNMKGGSGGTTNVEGQVNYKSTQREREALYEAYNALHTLAQEFHKPFDAPAVIVVGHQTSGKSALIEALMGFQFNQVRLHLKLILKPFI